MSQQDTISVNKFQRGATQIQFFQTNYQGAKWVFKQVTTQVNSAKWHTSTAQGNRAGVKPSKRKGLEQPLHYLNFHKINQLTYNFSIPVNRVMWILLSNFS